jgi:threonine dehydrogenase-like Zn-dependent dehydrogenase
MRAVVFGSDGKAHVQDVPDPTPAADEVVLRVDYCGICGSDLHAAEPDFRPGVTMGHEFAGEIVELGAGVTGWSVGDRVTVNPNGDWCGACDLCRHGMYNVCPNKSGNTIGQARDGAMAPYAAIRARTMFRLPDTLSSRHAAWVEPVAVALRTVRRSGIGVGDAALVFGAGPIGLLVTRMLRIAGAGVVTVVEPNPVRAEAARTAGANRVVDPTVEPVEEVFPDPVTAPAFAFECTPVATVMRTAIRVLRPGGRLTVTGFSRRDPSFSAYDFLFKEIEIRASFIYTDEFPAAIDLLARGSIDVEPLISGVMDFSRGPEAIEQMLTSTTTLKLLLTSA